MPPAFFYALAAAVGTMMMASILGTWLVLAAAVLAPLALFPVVRNYKRQQQSPEAARREEVREVGLRMREMIEQRRLHRDIDPGSLTLLEESARCWSRAHAAFESPYWTSTTLPLDYQAARDKARSAADESMGDILLLYRNHVPERVGSRPAMDYVDEALENFVFKGRTDSRMPPPAFHTARHVAEKLKSLADEAEALGQDGVRDASIPAPPVVGHSLEAALCELRTIREAEEELRQDLRG